MMQIFKRFERIRGGASAVLLSLAWLVLLGPEGAAQTVLSRARLGNNVEDMTYVNAGPLANHIITLDGYEVYGLPGAGHGNAPFRKLFDLRALPIKSAPRGMAYVEPEQLFVLQDPAQNSTLFFVNYQGQLQTTRTIQYLGGFEPAHLEDLAYLPATSPVFPDRLLMVVWEENEDCDDGLGSRIEVLTRGGQVEAEIFPDAPLRCQQLGGISLLAPDQLVVTDFTTNIISKLDFDGHAVAPPVTVNGATAIDGIVQLRDGRVVTADYVTGKLYYMDAGLNRRPGEDRSNQIGFGISGPHGVAWNTDTGQHLVVGGPTIQQAVVFSVPTTLDSATGVVTNLAASGFERSDRLSYMPDEHRIVISHRNTPRAILLYDNSGNFTEQISSPAFLPPNLRAVEYVPTTQQFVARFGANPLLRILSRTGALDGLINLTPTGLAAVGGIAYFDPTHPSGGQLLLLEADTITNGQRAIITDFNGQLLGEFNYRDKLGVLSAQDLAFISTGAQAGAFSLIDFDSSEIVVFSLD